MIDIAQQQTVLRFVNNEPNIPVDPDRPKVAVLCFVQLVKTQSRTGGIHLQIERRRLDRLLLLTGQARQAVSERIGDTKFHRNLLLVRD